MPRAISQMLSTAVSLNPIWVDRLKE